MSQLPWQFPGGGFPAAGAGSADREMEALQSDVMRFMAILGLCLMAVFALVKSLPLQPADPRPRLEDQAQLQADTARLAREVEALRREADRLRAVAEAARDEARRAALTARSAHQARRSEAAAIETRIADLRAEAQGLRSGVEAARQAALQQLAAARAAGEARQREAERLEALRRRSRQAAAEADTLAGRLEAQRERLRTLEGRVRERSRGLASLRREAELEGRRVDYARGRLQALEARLAQAEAAPEPESEPVLAVPEGPVTAPTPESVSDAEPAESARKPAADPAARETRKGFALRFASDRALDRLVADGRIQVYAGRGERAWRLALPGGRPTLVEAPRPASYHEMTRTTVPERYRSALRRGTTLRPEQVVWQVTLPEAIHAALRAAMKGHEGGDLTIQADGSVRLR